jgi:hypothetical protein
MREIYKTYSQKGKKQVKITNISIALLVAAIFIISAAAPAMSVQTRTTKLNVKTPENEEIISAGPAPINRDMPFSSDIKSSDFSPAPIEECYTMYGYHAWSSDDKLVYFDTCDPGTHEELGETIAGLQCSGGTYGCDGIWYMAQYDNGLLYGADITTGDMWSIGGGGQGLNALSYDPTSERMYGVGGPGSPGQDYLIEVDPATGAQGDEIGKLGGSIYFTIGIAFDAEGILYGWDVATDDLFTIDTETGEATVVAELTQNLNYGQDGDFHRESDTLYLTATFATGQTALTIVDKETGECTIVDYFPGNVQVTASCFENLCEPPEHDVAIKSIDSPATGRAEPDMPMTITVKNQGNNTETFDAQMEIIKCEAGPLIYEEYFDDCVMPDGWDTDYWDISYTSNAGGSPCEARAYKYNNGGQYYDNYIMSNYTDCTGLEKVNLRFRWAGDYYYPQYISVYVKFRRNSTSPWKDVTPWDNPVGENQDGELYEIGCYGFGEPMGDEFQMMWQMTGYYYYFNYLYLDDITLEACGGCAEYAELVEDITLDIGEETQIQFPTWTPSEWHNETSENSWEEYPIHAFLIMDEDDNNTRNDDKWILIDLWYPWMHDIEVMSIDSPQGSGESIPGQTFPVQATMRNVGQYDECCIPIDLVIGEPYELGTILTEDFSSFTCPPAGWTDENDYISSYYGWRMYYGNKAEGTYPEAYVPYYYIRQDYVFYSYAIDTSDYGMLRLRFKSFVDHWLGQGYYSLEAGYSHDAETWYAAWHVDPSSNEVYDVDVPIEGGSETTYIGFWLKGNYVYMDYWHLDDIEVVALGVDEEYSDFACQGPDIAPGEEATFTMEDWTPAFLAEETTGQKEYIVECFIEMEGDKNPGNDVRTESLILDFWHDVGIDEITSPVGGCWDRMGDDVLWDNGEPDGRNGIAGGMYNGYSNMLADDFELDGDYAIQGGKVHFLWNSGSSSNLETVRMYFFEETGDCEPSEIEYPEEGYFGIAAEFTEETTGTYYFGRPEIVVDFLLEEEILLGPGDWWVAIQPDGNSEDIAYILTSPDKGCEMMADLPYWGIPRWTPSSSQWGACDLSYEVHGRVATGPPSPDAFIQPGTEDIEVVVENYGTFPKEDLTCYVEIWEYITDAENGTQVYTDQIDNIDLTTPLGGQEVLTFTDFTFADEGRYGMYVDFPAAPDDEDKNNYNAWGVYIDDTEPESDYPPIFDPAEPTGEAGWYVDDVTVTLNASDPWSNFVQSGVREIRYTINGGGVQVIDGSTGSFVITEDGDDIMIEYWAVDCVGNEESPHNQITIDMDQTVPDVSLSYEVLGWSPMEGWEFQFTAIANDAMSDMNRVEFYFNNEIQETVTGTGPEYVWTLFYYPLPGDAIFRATAFDNAGLFDSDEVINPETSSRPHSHQSQEVPRQQPLPR